MSSSGGRIHIAQSGGGFPLLNACVFAVGLLIPQFSRSQAMPVQEREVLYLRMSREMEEGGFDFKLSTELEKSSAKANPEQLFAQSGQETLFPVQLRLSDDLGERVAPPAMQLRLAQFISARKDEGPVPERGPLDDRTAKAILMGRTERELLFDLPADVVAVTDRDLDQEVGGTEVPTGMPETAVNESVLGLPDLSGEDWQLAPIRWGGQLISNLNHVAAENRSSLSSSRLLNLNASSYVYAPWVAQTSGYAHLSTSNSKSSGGDLDQDTENQSRALGIGGTANILPQSEFPLMVSIDRMDSRSTSSDDASSGNVLNRFNATQLYTPRAGNDRYQMNLSHSTSEDQSQLRTTDTTLSGNLTRRIDEYENLSGNFNYTTHRQNMGGEQSSMLGLSGSHFWDYDDEWKFNSSGYFSNAQSNNFQSNVIQANSNIVWQPFNDEDEPLPFTVTGGGGVTHINSTSGGIASNTTLLNASAAMTYPFAERMVGSFSTGFSHAISSETGARTFMSGNANLTYSGLPQEWKEYRYHWGASANSTVQHVTDIGLITLAGGNFFHGVSRSFPFIEKGSIGLSLSQSVGMNNNSLTGSASTLNHSGSLSWSQVYSEQVSSNLVGTVSDNQSFGENPNHVRSFTLNGTGQWLISRRASVNVAGNLNWNWQEAQQAKINFGGLTFDPNPSLWSGSASLSYMHSSPFNIPRLAYSASMIYSASQAGGLAPAGSASNRWKETRIFNHQMNYFVGKLRFQLINVISQSNDQQNVIIFGQIIRQLN